MSESSHASGAVLATAPDEIFERATFRQIAWRLLPLLVVSYIFNFIDRTNIAVAALTMNADLGLSPSQFGYGAGLLFVGYCLFEIPSNLALYRFGASRWLARIMISWGIVSAAMIFVVGPNSFYLARFLLGVAEAGFFPGAAYYLSCWFPAAYRARIIAWFLVAIPASSLLGSPISGLLLNLDGLWGLAGWKWVFLLEALPCVVLGVLVRRFLPDTPEAAPWLSPGGRALVRQRLAEEIRVRPTGQFRALLRDARVWILGCIYFGFTIGSYGIQVWLPLILKAEHFSNTTVGFLAAIPYLFAVIGMIAWAGFVDRHGRRIDNVTVTCLLAAVGFGVALWTGTFLLSFAGLCIALVGVNAARAVFWAIPSRYLTGIAAAGGLALINSIGTLGGFAGPWIVGALRESTGSFAAGLTAMAGFLTATAVFSAPAETGRGRGVRPPHAPSAARARFARSTRQARRSAGLVIRCGKRIRAARSPATRSSPSGSRPVATQAPLAMPAKARA